MSFRRDIEAAVTSPTHTLRVAINRDWRTGNLDIHFVRYDMAEKKKYIAKFGELEWVPVASGEIIPNGLGISLPPELESGFIEAIEQALENEGRKPKAQERIEGELSAKEAHLKDLRQLLKLK